MDLLKIIIAGRPNVGKSTLFNRLIKKKISIVDNAPGTTRDYKKAEVTFGSLPCLLFDTAGIEVSSHEGLDIKVRSTTKILLDSADIILFITDAKSGLTASDTEFAGYLRKFNAKIFLLCNKMEMKGSERGFWDFFSLGIGEPLPVSASEGLGLSSLKTYITNHITSINPYPNHSIDEDFLELKKNCKKTKSPFLENNSDKLKRRGNSLIKLAIIGRPNVGKSTLLNSILGEKRVITSAEAGTTTDPIAVTTNWLDNYFEIVDTAGIRRAGKVCKGLEEFSVLKAFEVIKFSEIVLMILDNERALDAQDLRIINFIYKEGRGLVLAVNKWDKEKNKKGKILIIKKKIFSSLPQFADLPIITISALKNKGIEKLQKGIIEAYKNWVKRVSTANLNKWLFFKIQDHPPPMVKGRRIKLRYITQVKARPPTFIIFLSYKCEVPKSYERYLINGLRKDFRLYNVPIRLSIKVGNNPYVLPRN